MFEHRFDITRFSDMGEAVTENTADNRDVASAETDTGSLTDTSADTAADMQTDTSACDPSVTEDAQARGADPEEEKGAVDDGRIDMLAERAAELVRRARDVQQTYPDFDLAAELRDPRFAAILRAVGDDPALAYEIKYHDMIMTAAMQYAVQQTEMRLANSIQETADRPDEGGAMRDAAVLFTDDPKKLTKAQRARIKKRVRSGERIIM